MLKGQAAALLTASTDEESEILNLLDIKYEGGRPNLERTGKDISLAAGFPPSEPTSGQATGRTYFMPKVMSLLRANKASDLHSC